MGLDDHTAELDLPCKLTWSDGYRHEVRGKAMQLSSAAAMAVLRFGPVIPVPQPGTTVEMEILLPENPLTLPKCIFARGRIDRATEISGGAHLIACTLMKTTFKECTDPTWLANRNGVASSWKM